MLRTEVKSRICREQRLAKRAALLQKDVASFAQSKGDKVHHNLQRHQALAFCGRMFPSQAKLAYLASSPPLHQKEKGQHNLKPKNSNTNKLRVFLASFVGPRSLYHGLGQVLRKTSFLLRVARCIIIKIPEERALEKEIHIPLQS